MGFHTQHLVFTRSSERYSVRYHDLLLSFDDPLISFEMETFTIKTELLSKTTKLKSTRTNCRVKINFEIHTNASNPFIYAWSLYFREKMQVVVENFKVNLCLNVEVHDCHFSQIFIHHKTLSALNIR